MSEELNNFFQNTTIFFQNSSIRNNVNDVLDLADKAFFKYKNYSSIFTIKNLFGATTPFFTTNLLNLKILTEIWKISKNNCSETLTALFNITVLTGNFRTELKLADVTPVRKSEPVEI